MKTKKEVLERLQRFDAVAWLYNALQSESRIAWLYIVYRPQEYNTIEDYNEVRRGRRRLNLIGDVISILIFFGAWLVDHLISRNLLNDLGPESMGWNLLFHLVAGGLWFGFLVYPFWIYWTDYIVIWTDENWRNKDFPKDVESLVRFLFHLKPEELEYNKSRDILSSLCGSGCDAHGDVPRHAVELAESRVAQAIASIVKERSKCRGSEITSSIISKKDLLKKNFELCKRFQLISEGDQLRFRYSRAETSLKQKK